MKKLLAFIIGIGVLSFAPTVSNAQVRPTTLYSTAYGNATDTITNTTAHYFPTPKLTIGPRDIVCLSVRAIEISGTTDGLVTLEASSDSVTWYPYFSGTVMKDTTGGPLQLDLADVTTVQGIRWRLTEVGDYYLRAKIVGVGTPSISVTSKYWVKKD